MSMDVIGMILDKRETAALMAGLAMLRTPACWHGSHAEKIWGIYTRMESISGLNEEELEDLFFRLTFREENLMEDGMGYGEEQADSVG
jgi:hypothetical protein